MGGNCNWICRCLCQQFPFVSVGVAVITPYAKRHVAIHTRSCYYSLSRFFFWDSRWRHRGSAQCVVSTNRWRWHCLSCLLVSNGTSPLEMWPFDVQLCLCQVVSEHSSQVSAVASTTLSVLPKRCPPVLSEHANLETKQSERMGFKSANGSCFAWSFYGFTLLPLKLSVWGHLGALVAVSFLKFYTSCETVFFDSFESAHAAPTPVLECTCRASKQFGKPLFHFHF